MFGSNRQKRRSVGQHLWAVVPHAIAFLHLCLLRPQATDLGASPCSLSFHWPGGRKGRDWLRGTQCHYWLWTPLAPVHCRAWWCWLGVSAWPPQTKVRRGERLGEFELAGVVVLSRDGSRGARGPPGAGADNKVLLFEGQQGVAQSFVIDAQPTTELGPSQRVRRVGHESLDVKGQRVRIVFVVLRLVEYFEVGAELVIIGDQVEEDRLTRRGGPVLEGQDEMIGFSRVQKKC